MRKVKITKQQTVNPKAVYVNLVMAFVFVELLIFVGLAVIRINGMNLFKWIIVMFQSPIFRPYQSKGVLDRYEEEKEE